MENNYKRILWWPMFKLKNGELARKATWTDVMLVLSCVFQTLRSPQFLCDLYMYVVKSYMKAMTKSRHNNK